MYGLAPTVVYDEMDARDVRALFSAGLRFEQARGAIWLASLVGGIGDVSGRVPASLPDDPVPAGPDVYEPPDRVGFYHAVKVMR